jgi:uncharacterized protein
MRWQGRRRSSNVEDIRRSAGPKLVFGGGIGGVILIVIFLLLGGDPRMLLDIAQQSNPSAYVEPGTGEQNDELSQFVAVVLADTEDVWRTLFQQQLGRTYEEPKLVLFSDQVRSACGFASAASGPFYCPEDHRLYIDLSFYRTLHDRFGAPGDFAQAYVIAHEVGHHVQNLLGISDRVQSMRGRLSETDYNQLSVRVELQADFFAGIWAHYADRTKQIVEEGDIEEALNAASAIGDDRLQRETQGTIVPDSFTHGSSEQRMRWFRRGYETGDLRQGDTFNAREL